jgi:hypothetical protein
MSPTSWKAGMVVPSIGKAHEAGTVGTAFDYVARALLTRQVGKENVEVQRPVAQEGLAVLPGYLQQADRTLQLEADSAIRSERMQGLDLARLREEELMVYLGDRLREAMTTQDAFIEGASPIEEYVPHTLFLARLDAVFRSGSVVIIDEFLRSVTGRSFFSQKSSVSDLELASNILSLAETFSDYFHDVRMSHIWLNPVFMPYSVRVDGADADFIFDSTLIDIKSTTKLGYSSEDWAQVLGYLAMARAIGMPIDRAGIYFARYALCALVLVTSEISDLLAQYLEAILIAAEHDGN